jgi:hypothetical protein
VSIADYLKAIFAEPEAQIDSYESWNAASSANFKARLSAGQAFNAAAATRDRITLAAVRSAPSREEFAAWRDHPVTQFVFVALNAAAGEQRKAWDETSWEGGSADENLLLELRVRADAYNSMQEADYEGFCEWAGVEPEPVEQGAWAS